MVLVERDLVLIEILVGWLIEVHYKFPVRKLCRKLGCIDLLEYVPEVDESLNTCVFATKMMNVLNVEMIGRRLYAGFIAVAVSKPRIQSEAVHAFAKDHPVQLHKLRPEDKGIGCCKLKVAQARDPSLGVGAFPVVPILEIGNQGVPFDGIHDSKRYGTIDAQ